MSRPPLLRPRHSQDEGIELKKLEKNAISFCKLMSNEEKCQQQKKGPGSGGMDGGKYGLGHVF